MTERSGGAWATEAAHELYVQDEILEAMYWLLGEGFGSEVAVPDLLRFLQVPEADLQRQVLELTAKGYLEVVDGQPTHYRLTEQGTAEAHRRFVDDFETFIGHSGHGICDRPDCWCRQGAPPESCPARAEVVSGDG